MLDAVRSLHRLAVLAAAMAVLLSVTTARPARASWDLCPGDCDGDFRVLVNELILGVKIGLDASPIDICPSFRGCNGDGTVTINCLIQAVNRALNGCEASVPDPTVSGPITSGAGVAFVAGTGFNLAELGYSEAEYFVTGTAAAYVNTAPLTSDGAWATARSETTAPYTTRMVVYRPIDPERFNGTVLVEWLNVSGGLDAAPDWLLAHTELIREGYAYVGVSAQYVGIHGGGSLGIISLPLKTVDPVRYAPLSHPGDSFSYDIYSQVAEAVLRPTGIRPLGDLKIERMIAAGESQSAFRMVTYINGVDPQVRLFDGFLVHSRAGNGAPLSQTPQAEIASPSPLFVRPDVRVPVLTFETETDLTFLGFTIARQDDGDRLRTWEVAGTAHADSYTYQEGRMDRGDSPAIANLVLINAVAAIHCNKPLNSGPQHWVLKAAVAALNAWVKDGTPPPISPRLEVETSGTTVTLPRDEHGNALGGIRTPYVDAPIATFEGEQEGSVVCRLFGSTTLFDETKLAALYPDHASYVDAFKASTDAAVAAGFLRPADAALLKTNAEQSDIGG